MDRNREFVRLWTQHSWQVYAYLLALVPNRADAEDLLQETGVTAWEAFQQFSEGSNFFAWACRIAFNRVGNFRRRRNVTALLLDDELLETLGSELVSSSEVISRDLAALTECLKKLRARDRDLIERRYRVGATMRKVSDEVGRSVESLYKAIRRIQETLFDCVRRQASGGDLE